LDYGLFFLFYSNVEREKVKMTKDGFANQILIIWYLLFGFFVRMAAAQVTSPNSLCQFYFMLVLAACSLRATKLVELGDDILMSCVDGGDCLQSQQRMSK